MTPVFSSPIIRLMDNPNGNFQAITIGTVGTVLQRDHNCSLHVIVPEVSVGTVTLYDSATTAGTAASNRILAFTGGTSVQDCFPKTYDIQFRNGLVTVALGTPVAVLGVA